MKDSDDKLGVYDLISLTVATWFGSGLLPVMPGTWGTIAAIPLVAAMAFWLDTYLYIAVTALITIVGIPLAARTAHLYRNHPKIMRLNPHAKRVFKDEKLQQYIKDPEDQKKDPGMIVIDEVAGYATAMILVPPSFTALIIAFLFFRIFDIIKIQPGKILEKLGSGVGIMLDDIAAGIYACLMTNLLIWTYMQFNLPALP